LIFSSLDIDTPVRHTEGIFWYAVLFVYTLSVGVDKINTPEK
jgi:hypothetical protein